MSSTLQEITIPAPELRGAVTELAKYPELEIGLDGPAGTGKTFGILYFIHILLLSYPGAKWLVARKRNTDLAGSALATFRENVLDERENVHFFGGSKERPPGYMYPNGSLMAVNGLDKPGKVKSMDFDGIYLVEATDCTLEDIEMCHIRLARRKNSVLPQRFQKLLMCFNPDAPTHFLNQRMNDGLTRRLLSRHEDNPFLWDANTQDWTEAGYRYIGELDKLTGVRLSRYRYGIWAAAEGTVYEDSWDRNRNVIDRFPIPADWPRYLSLDFGYTNPFVCAWWAMDPDGRLYCYREIYKTKTLVEDHAKQIKHYSRWGQDGGDPLPRELICDHDAEGRATLERHLGLHTMPAHKAVLEGIQAVSSRLKPAGDGRPRLMWFRDALVERDMELAAKKKPTCTVEEMDTYVWKQSNVARAKEEPVKEDDHGCLVAGTMVTTSRGDVPIEQITAGDYVLTRSGYKRVKAAGMTAKWAEVHTAYFSNGAKLTGTGNHPIYLDGQGYTPLRAMRYGDIIMTTEQAYERLSLWEKTRENQKSSPTKVSSLDAILNHSHGVLAITTALTQAIDEQVCCASIKKYGATHTVQFQRDMKFITKMKTRLIMLWIIWNVFQKKSIRSATNFMKSHRVDSFYESKLLQRCERQQNSGTVLLRVKHGMARWLEWLGMKRNSTIMFVNNVVNHFNLAQWTGTRLYSARMPVSPHGVISQGLITRHDDVSDATKSLLAIATQKSNTAHQLVSHNTSNEGKSGIVSIAANPLRCYQAAKSDIVSPHVLTVTCTANRAHVYNLTVETNAVGEGEYFANGILVHNCDQTRYIVARFDLRPTDVRYSSRIY